jgi:hypothetical protein
MVGGGESRKSSQMTILGRPLAALTLLTLACSSPRSSISSAATDGAAPYLTELELSVSGLLAPSSPIELVPAFSPAVFDYYVRCAAEVNALAVSMTASPGASSAVVQPIRSPAQPTQTVTLSANENQAIVATATAGNVTTEYWVRCLPHDFPVMNMAKHVQAGTPPRGYYLLGTSLPATGAQWGYAMVLNGDGVPVWYTHGPNGSGVDDVDDVVAGAVSFLPSFGQHPFEIHHLDPPKTTYAAPSGAELDTHELRVLANGHYLVISAPTVSGFDLTGLVAPLPDGGIERFGPGSSIADCDLVEFDPTTGAVAWKWVGADHFDPVKDSTSPQASENRSLPDGGVVLDVFHCNSIDIDPENGNLLVSARDMSSVFYIERSTGKVLWKMGGTSYSTDNAHFVQVADPFYQQHDARFQPGWSSRCGGSGQISLFDDHSHTMRPARGVVYDLTVGNADGGSSGEDCGAGQSATVAWQYESTANSNDQGSFRISSDGSRVIDWGTIGGGRPVFTEVDLEGHDLLDFYFSDHDVSYRVIKAPLTAFDLSVLRRTAGQ